MKRSARYSADHAPGGGAPCWRFVDVDDGEPPSAARTAFIAHTDGGVRSEAITRSGCARCGDHGRPAGRRGALPQNRGPSRRGAPPTRNACGGRSRPADTAAATAGGTIPRWRWRSTRWRAESVRPAGGCQGEWPRDEPVAGFCGRSRLVAPRDGAATAAGSPVYCVAAGASINRGAGPFGHRRGCAGGGIIRASVATRYQRFVRHAGRRRPAEGIYSPGNRESGKDERDCSAGRSADEEAANAHESRSRTPPRALAARIGGTAAGRGVAIKGVDDSPR